MCITDDMNVGLGSSKLTSFDSNFTSKSRADVFDIEEPHPSRVRVEEFVCRSESS